MSLHDEVLKCYHLVLKSGCEAPDYEREVEAFDEMEAVKEFQRHVDLDAQTIIDNMEII